jgi:glycosyltransferase involved in cell wall biosynthesis/predicted metal-dependent phosphoesterase TrpH
VDRLCKADLHVHSRHSNRPSLWALRRFNCPESYTEPLAIYRAAKKRGMDLVTITDHNSLDGSLAISHLPGTFASAEMTCYLPEDGCKVHVVVLNVEPVLFPDILEARHNVYELVAYLRHKRVAHFLAHPLFDVNRKLTPATIEKLLLLFDAVEVRNGARAARYNRFTEAMVRSLTPELYERLAERHGVEPIGERPWEKALVGGSDDHSGLFVTSAHTLAECDGTPEGFVAAILNRRSRPSGDDGDALTLAHSIYAIGYRFFAGTFTAKTKPVEDQADGRSPANGNAGAGGYSREHNLNDRRNGRRNGRATRGRRSHGGGFTPLLSVAAKRFLEPDGGGLSLPDKARLVVRRLLPDSVRRDPRSFEEMLEREAWRLAKDREFLATLPPDSLNRRIFAVSSRLVDRLLFECTQRLFDLRLDHGLAGMIEPLSTLGLVQLLTVPYYISYHNQTRGRDLMRALVETFPSCRGTGHQRIALFTDTLNEINGVALTLRRLQGVARAQDVDLILITSSDAPTGLSDGVMNFRSVGDIRIPEYPDLALRFPPVLDVFDYLEREGFTHVHVSTPGTVGLLGILAAKLLDLPVAGSYHTDLPQYVRRLTDDEGLEDIVWGYVAWLHSQFDELLVPSETTMRQLAEHGISRQLMRPLPRWVDLERFSPTLRDPALWPMMGVLGRVRLLYAGRVSREKDLPLLVDVFRGLVKDGHDVSLVVAGDGPFREQMQRQLAGYPAFFLGFLSQERLAHVYASADVFVFPSSTDTFGNVVLEAQACGLPVLVSDEGGPQELIGSSGGLVLPAHNRRAWTAALAALIGDDQRRLRMGREARRFVEERAMTTQEHFTTLLFPGGGSDRRSRANAEPSYDGAREVGGRGTTASQLDADTQPAVSAV